MSGESGQRRPRSTAARVCFLLAAVVYSVAVWTESGPLFVILGLTLGAALILLVKWQARRRRRA